MELIVITPTKLKIMLTPPDMKRYDLSPTRMDCADEETRRSFRRIFNDARTQIGFDTTGERLFVQLYTSRGGGCEIFVTKLGEGDGAQSRTDTDAPDAPGIGIARSDGAENCLADEADDPAIPPEAPEEALLRRVFSVESDEADDEANDITPTKPAPAIPVAGESVPSAAGASPSHPTPPRTPAKPRLTAHLPRRATTRPAALMFGDMDTLLCACRRLSENRYDGESCAYILDSGTCCLLLHVPDTSFFRLPAPFAFLTEYGDETDPGTLMLYLREHASLLCEKNAVRTLGALA